MTSDMVHFKLEAEISGLKCSFNAGDELEFRYSGYRIFVHKPSTEFAPTQTVKQTSYFRAIGYS